MNEQEETVKRLRFENYIWVVYIVIAVGNIIGDELIRKSILQGDKQSDQLAKKIFSISLIVTLLIYFYFLSRNYNDYEKHKNEEAYYIRFLGSIFVLIGTLCFLYFQYKTTQDEDTVSNI